MHKKIIAFFTAKIFLTRGQVITQGMLYALEKEVADLKKSIRGHKASYTRLQGRHDVLTDKYNRFILDSCETCEGKQYRGEKET
jgi:hypothetical protein